MSKVSIVIELIDNKFLNVSGPLESNREICVDMLKEALKVVETYNGGVLAIPGGIKFVELSKEHMNHQIRKQL